MKIKELFEMEVEASKQRGAHGSAIRNVIEMAKEDYICLPDGCDLNDFKGLIKILLENSSEQTKNFFQKWIGKKI